MMCALADLIRDGFTLVRLQRAVRGNILFGSIDVGFADSLDTEK